MFRRMRCNQPLQLPHKGRAAGRSRGGKVSGSWRCFRRGAGRARSRKQRPPFVALQLQILHRVVAAQRDRCNVGVRGIRRATCDDAVPQACLRRLLWRPLRTVVLKPRGNVAAVCPLAFSAKLQFCRAEEGMHSAFPDEGVFSVERRSTRAPLRA